MSWMRQVQVFWEVCVATHLECRAFMALGELCPNRVFLNKCSKRKWPLNKLAKALIC